jgi:hypothetical protein
LIRHNNNKTGCGSIKNTIINEDNEKKKGIKIFRKINTLKLKIKKLDEMFDDNKCGYCKKIFSNKSNLKIHIQKRCAKKKIILTNIKELTDELDKPDKSDIVENNIINNNNTNNGTINNTTNNTTNNINNTINITLNPFGKEDLSHITDANYRKYMLDIFPGFLNFITKIYYDDEMPSNHNICIKNIKSNDGCIFDGKKWNLTDRDELITALINHKTKILNNKYEEFEENNEVSEKLEEAFTHFVTKMRKSKDEGKDNLKKQLQYLLYNNREKIKKIEDKS